VLQVGRWNVAGGRFFVPPATEKGHWCALALQVERISPTCNTLLFHLPRFAVPPATFPDTQVIDNRK
jgi:hypothetical protein